MKEYKIIKKDKKYYKQEEELNVDMVRIKLQFWKDKKEQMLKDVESECQPKIDELTKILEKLPN